MLQFWTVISGVFTNLSRGGGGGAQLLLVPENPLKSIDFTGPGGLAPIATPPDNVFDRYITNKIVLGKIFLLRLPSPPP